MSYRITEDCVSCGDCSVVCPEKAIDDGYLPRTGDGTSSAAGAAWTDSPWRGYRSTILYKLWELCGSLPHRRHCERYYE